jgi:hypothetical protein
MANTSLNIETTEISALGDSKVGSCSEAPHTRAAGQHLNEQSASGAPLTGGKRLPASDFSFENLEGLTEKVGTLGLQTTWKRRSGAAKKRMRKARFAEAPTGDSAGGQPQTATGGRPQTRQEPST